jgi:hypothetical protein
MPWNPAGSWYLGGLKTSETTSGARSTWRDTCWESVVRVDHQRACTPTAAPVTPNRRPGEP